MPTFKLFNPCQPCCVSSSGISTIPCCTGFLIPDTLCAYIWSDQSFTACPCLGDAFTTGSPFFGSGQTLSMDKVPTSGNIWYGNVDSALCNVKIGVTYQCSGVDEFGNLVGDLILSLGNKSQIMLNNGSCPLRADGSGFIVDTTSYTNLISGLTQYTDNILCFCSGENQLVDIILEPSGLHSIGGDTYFDGFFTNMTRRCEFRPPRECCDGHLSLSFGGTTPQNAYIPFTNNLMLSILSANGCCFEGQDILLNHDPGFSIGFPFAANCSGDDNYSLGIEYGCVALSNPQDVQVRIQCSSGIGHSQYNFGSNPAFGSSIVESCCPLQIRLYKISGWASTDSWPFGGYRGCCIDPSGAMEALITEI